MTTDELVDEIFGRCRERMERGEAVDVEEVLRVHPDLADALRERFAAARLVDRAGARGRAARREALATTRVGRPLGPYRIESVLGVGGMGTVYLARAEGPDAAAAPGTAVAVKVFHPHLVARERFVERFLREAELGRRVRHANVVRTLAAEEVVEGDQTIRFLVMEHVEGRTLRTLLDEMGRLPEQLCRHIGREVATGLAAIHAARAVHRDLKPENVIVTKDHAVQVMDLGVARVEDAATLSESGAFVGSLRYGAPEQFGLRSAKGNASAAAVDARADLHALGLLLYELATGVHPFAGGDFAELVRQILDLRPGRCGELVPQLSPFFEELVAQLLEKDRERRPESAEAVAAILTEGEESAWWKERAVAIRRETRRPLRRIRIPRETALYGRDADVARLRALFEKAKVGDGQVVLVEGEAGIGKSRLVDEFVLSLWAEGEDIDFLFGSYPPGGAATASGAFSTAYRAHLGDDETAVREALPQTPLLVPAFAALLRGDAPPEGAEKLTRDSIQTLFVHATRSFAARRTTIVLVDDLHFAPEEGRGLFTSLALATPGHRILLVGGARRSLDEKWAANVTRLPNMSRLPLERLSPKELVALLKDSLKSEHLARELAGRIGEKSDGNPFFVFEILRGLREGRFLTRKPDGTWITTRSIREIEVPPSIVEVIQARVSDLDKDERDLLDVATCIGFEFDASLVGAVLGVAPIPLLQRLGRIEKAHRLVRSVGHEFAFDHHQVQEVLYTGLSAPLREAYHAAIAEAIEQRSGAASKQPKDLDGALCVDLAEHFLRGAEGNRGLHYLDAALTHLETRWLNEAAVRLCERALAAPGVLAGGERCNVLLRLVHRLRAFGRSDQQRAAAEEALALARESGDAQLEVRASGALGVALQTSGLIAESRELHERSLALAREIGNRDGEVKAMTNLGIISAMLARFAEAQAPLEHALALAREIGNRRDEAFVMMNLGTISELCGRYADAQAHHERSLALARKIGDRQIEVFSTAHLGMVSSYVGHFTDALAHLERCLALAREIGNRESEIMATLYLGDVFSALGRFTEAAAQHERQLALAYEFGDLRTEGNATGQMGIFLHSVGRFAEARELFVRQIEIARELGDPNSEAIALANRGCLRLALGDSAGARSDLDTSLALCRKIGARQCEGYVIAGLAEASQEVGDAPTAARLAEEALALRRSIGHVVGVVESLVALGGLRRQAGDEPGARAALEEAVTRARELRRQSKVALALALLASLSGGDPRSAESALAEAGGSLESVDGVEVRWLLWQATHDRAHLVEAKRLLDFIVEHAPPECREPMLANVRLHREIVAACKEQGL